MIKLTKSQSEQHAIVIGWLSVVGFFLAISIGIVNSPGQLAQGCLIVFCVFGGISSALLLFGICKEKYLYVLPWLVHMFVVIMLLLFVCFFDLRVLGLLLFVTLVWISILIDFMQLKKLQIEVPIIEPTTASV